MSYTEEDYLAAKLKGRTQKFYDLRLNCEPTAPWRSDSDLSEWRLVIDETTINDLHNRSLEANDVLRYRDETFEEWKARMEAQANG